MHGTEQMILNYQAACIERDKLHEVVDELIRALDQCLIQADIDNGEISFDTIERAEKAIASAQKVRNQL